MISNNQQAGLNLKKEQSRGKIQNHSIEHLSSFSSQHKSPSNLKAKMWILPWSRPALKTPCAVWTRGPLGKIGVSPSGPAGPRLGVPSSGPAGPRLGVASLGPAAPDLGCFPQARHPQRWLPAGSPGRQAGTPISLMQCHSRDITSRERDFKCETRESKGK